MTVSEALAKLRVKPGLQGMRIRIDPQWAVGFWYDRDLSKFTLSLSYNYREQVRQLAESEYETRGRSNWMTDNTWRLTAAGIEKWSRDIEAAMAKMRARSQ